jgi:hypothetical protein
MAEEWAVTTPAGQVRIADLPLTAVVTLETDCELEWWRIAAHPIQTARVASYVYAACCEFKGAKPAELTMRDLLEGTFETVEEDLPTLYEGGIPKAGSEAEAVTPGSSGAQESSAGPQT